ncbi:unnamed protein product [Allacma fusca]|uniref:Uncharacterized protein n=1 Tax=Allacma fusca TaxID=39272 RepID=A0A8J2LSU8_9HEXA|nr:unnamed protein product [Allacma fusca]
MGASAQMEPRDPILSTLEPVEPVALESDSLEDFDLIITDEDYEALAKIFSHSPGLEQIFEDVIRSDLQLPLSSASLNEPPEDNPLDVADTKISPLDVSMVQQGEGVVKEKNPNNLGLDLAKNDEWNKPNETNIFSDPTSASEVWKEVNYNEVNSSLKESDTKKKLKNEDSSSNEFPEVFILKSAEAYGKFSLKSEQTGFLKKKPISEKKIPQVPAQPKIIHPTVFSEEKKSVLTFSFSEEYPEFSKEISSTRTTHDFSHVRTPEGNFKTRKNPQPQKILETTSSKPKQAFVFSFPKRPKKIHDWYAQQKQTVDEIEKKNASKFFFQIPLTLRDGSKLVCERSKKLLLDEPKISSEITSAHNEGPQKMSQESLKACSSKGNSDPEKKYSTARKSCSKGSAKVLGKKNPEKGSTNKCMSKARRDILEKWHVWCDRNNSIKDSHGQRDEIVNDSVNGDESAKITYSFSDADTEFENDCEGSVFSEPPVVTISDDDDVIMLEANFGDSCKHKVITLS